MIVDNRLEMYDSHCEHLDLFPAIFRVLNDPAILILDVTPRVRKGRKRPRAAERYALRKAFYGVDDPDNMTFAEVTRLQPPCG